MSFKIRVLIDGLKKSGVIENGKIIRKTLMRGEIAEVEHIDEGDMKRGYYKVFVPKIVVPAGIERSREVVRQPDNRSNAEDILATADSALDSITGLLDEGEVTQESNKEPSLILDSQGSVPAEFTTSDDEEEDDIYSEQEYRKGNEQYNSVLQNTLGHYMRNGALGDRAIRNTANLAAKRIPTISEAKLGKIKKEESSLVDSSGNPILEDKKIPVSLITDKDGKIDVRKTLGLKMINEPGASSEI